MIRNPKQKGSKFWDCVPQKGPCPVGCSQCFYNRPGAWYADISKPLIPDPAEVKDGIVRMNSGHDSNIERKKVTITAKQYKNYFFNTSINKLDFPGPVVYTANRDEESLAIANAMPTLPIPANLMFVRLRVSASNVDLVEEMAREWNMCGVVVVLTFMRYYEEDVLLSVNRHKHESLRCVPCYVYKKHVKNKYWCLTRYAQKQIMILLHVGTNPLITTCGTLDSSLCKDCMNCELYYWITKRRMRDVAQITKKY